MKEPFGDEAVREAMELHRVAGKILRVLSKLPADRREAVLRAAYELAKDEK